MWLWILCTHTHGTLQVVGPVGGVGWHWESEGNSEGKNVSTLPISPWHPRSAQSAIHHICISICILTSHTHATLNKLPSVWKHAPHRAAHSCTRSVYTHRHTAPHYHHVVLTLFSLDDHVQGSTSTMLLNRALYSTVTSLLFLFLFTKHWQLVPPSSSSSSSSNLPSSSFPLNPSNSFSSWCLFFFFQDAHIYHPTAFHPSFTLELHTILLFLFPTTLLPQRRCRIGEDGWTDNSCMEENTPGLESFQSLFLLQLPLIDSSNGTSLNTLTLISGSKQNISKASSCWVKTMKTLFPSLFKRSLLFFIFSLPLFCAFSLPGSFSVVSSSLSIYLLCCLSYPYLSLLYVCCAHRKSIIAI